MSFPINRLPGSQQQWQSLLNRIKGKGSEGTQGAQGAQGAGDVNDSTNINRGMRVSQKKSPPAVGGTSGAPEIDPPQTVDDDGSQIAKVSTKTSKVMFDLYQLMALLVEVAQKERDAARAQRDAESKSIQTSILAQAEQQRDAAITGAIIGGVCGLISAGVSIGMLSAQGVAYKQQLNAAAASGTDSAQTHVAMLKGADTEMNAHAQLSEVSNKVGADVFTSVSEGIDAKVAQQRTDFQNARTELQNAEATVTQRADALRDAGVDPDHINMDNLNADKATAQTELDQARTARDEFNGDQNSEEYQNLCQAVETKQAAFDTASNKVSLAEQYNQAVSDKATASANFEAKRSEYRTALENAASDYAESYSNASERKLNGGKTNDEQIKNAQEAYKQAKADLKAEDTPEHRQALKQATDNLIAADPSMGKKAMQMAYAYSADKLAEPGVTTMAEYKASLTEAKSDAMLATKALNSDGAYQSAIHNIEKYGAINNINTALGNMAQNVIQNVVAAFNAEATRKGAEQQQQQNMLDQTKDLFNQAEDMIKAVIDLMNAISAAETQSMRDAIQA